MPRSITRFAIPAMFLIGLCAIVYVLISASGGKPSATSLEKYARGELETLDFATAGAPAPTSAIIDSDGAATNLQALQGKVTLVNFWATWCGPCEREMPSLGALEAARGGDKFQIIAISVDDASDHDYARERLVELGAANLNFYAPATDKWDIVYAAGARVFPTSVIYGPDGTEIARLTGDADWSSIEAVNFIDAAITASP